MNNTTSVNIFNRTSAIHGPRKFMDIVGDNSNRIHHQLYERAIKSLIDDLDNYDSIEIKPEENQTWNDIIINIIEIPYSEYWTPSDVILTFKVYKETVDEQTGETIRKPKLKRYKFDLSPYWDNYFFKEKQRSIDIKYDKNIENDIEIVKYDYLRGKATFRSRLEGTEYEIDFNDIHNDDKVSEEAKLPNDLFIKLINVSK